MAASSAPSPVRRVAFWRDLRVLSAAGQVAFVVVVALIAGALYGNVHTALEKQGLVTGFSFLETRAGFNIGEGIPYTPEDSYGRAFYVGVVNTLRVVGIGIVLATLLGIVTGVSRLSSNWLVARLASLYVEIIRNTPVLVQLYFWYFAFILQLPRVKDSLQLPGPTFLSLRGISIPWLLPSESFPVWRIYLLAGLGLGLAVWVALAWRERQTGRAGLAPLWGLAAFALVALAGYLLSPAPPLVVDPPYLKGLNFKGGRTLSPEYAALLIGLVVYTAAFIAEIVRAGIQAVHKGQVEAARALGLTTLQTLRLVVFPQALRVIVPPLTSQYLNLAKNSSLAIAIGYPDLFSVGGTIFNQTGHALETIGLIMVSYLSMSLFTSLLLNLYNRRIRLVER